MASTSGYRPVETHLNEGDHCPPSSPLKPCNGHTCENSRSSLIFSNHGNSSDEGYNGNVAREDSLESTRSIVGFIPDTMSSSSPKRSGTVTERSALDDDADEDEFLQGARRNRTQAERVEDHEEAGVGERSGFSGSLRRLSTGLGLHSGKCKMGMHILAAMKKGERLFHDNRGLLMIAAAQVSSEE